MAYRGFDKNGNVISESVGTGPQVPYNNLTFFTGQYQYDNLNRLFQVTDTNYFRKYGYDEYGNLSLQQNSGVPLSGLTPMNPNGNGPNPYNPATNHLVSVDAAGGYDARGNITKLGAVTTQRGT